MHRNEVVETFVLNHMFDTLGFSEDYDIVLALYTHQKQLFQKFDTRLGNMPQWILCVKNTSAIVSVEEFPLKAKKDDIERQYRLYMSSV